MQWLKIERVVNLLKLLGPKPQVATRNHGRTMIEYLGELDERHLTMFTRRLHNLAAKSLAKTMRAKVLDIEVITSLDGLKMTVDRLRGLDCATVVEKAMLVEVLNIQGIVAVADMLLEGCIDFDVAALARLLLDEREAWATKQMLPFQGTQVGDAKTKKATTSYKK